MPEGRKEVTLMNKFLLAIIARAVAAASPEILENLRQLVQEMVAKAETTENPWDDIICGMVQMLVGKPGDSMRERS